MVHRAAGEWCVPKRARHGMPKIDCAISVCFFVESCAASLSSQRNDFSAKLLLAISFEYLGEHLDFWTFFPRKTTSGKKIDNRRTILDRSRTLKIGHWTLDT